MTALLTGNLPLIADAPDGIRKLRGLILELAVRGKLVPQDPDDEPASELLKRITQERAKLEAAGTCKKSKVTPLVEEDEPPFTLPTSWKWIRFSHLYPEFQNGESSRGVASGSEVVVLRLADISKGAISLSDTRSMVLPDSSIQKYQLQKNDILFIRVNGSTEIVGRLVLCSENLNAIYCDHFIRVRISQTSIAHRFFRLIGDAPIFRNQIQGLFITTAGQKTVNQGHIGGLIIPLPPLAEQHRIVAKVDELMALCDRLEAEQADTEAAHAYLVETVLAALTRSADAADFAANWQRLAAHFDTLFTTEAAIDALKQTVLQLAVTGKLVPQDPTDEPASELLKRIAEMREERLASGYPNINEAATQLRKQHEQSCPSGLARLPDGWSWATLMQSAELVVDCHNKTAPYSSSGIPLLRTTNIRNGSLNLREPKFVTNETYERWSARCKPQSGDLLITREAPMGEACIIPEGMTVCMGQRMMLIRLVPETIHPQFLLHTLLAPDMMERVQDKPVGATVEHLRVGGVETLLVAIPPLAEQNRIVAKVNELITLCDRLKADLATARQRQATLADTLIAAALEAA